jgi:hypothetical protein
MPMRRRWLRLVMFVSVTMMLGTPALASEESPAAKPAGTDDRVCLYTQGTKTDTPEIGPLPCDTSRPYMIGRSGLGSSRIPSNSEFNNGPLSHIDAGGSGSASESSSEPVEGTSASPSMGDVNSNRSFDSQAP